MERTGWLVAALIPALFVLTFFMLTLLAAPEHDDYCFAYLNAEARFIPTLIHFYTSLTGRVTSLAIIQLPQELASALSVRLLTTYPAVLLGMTALFAAGIGLAVARGWPGITWPRLMLLAATLVASMIALAPSPHELLYWLPAVACYVPPAIVAMIFLAELASLERLSPWRVVGMATAGLVVAMCNEFTAPWLLMIIAASFLVRVYFSLPAQFVAHAAISATTLAGFIVIVLAPGNAGRRSVLPRSGQLAFSLSDSFDYAFGRLQHFVSSPLVLLCIVLAAIVAAGMGPSRDRRRAAILAALIIVVSLACCYLAFFAHEYSTGIQMVERAQNQTSMLLLFSLSLAAGLLSRAFLAGLNITGALPATIITIVLGFCLCLSPSGRLLSAEFGSFRSFQEESASRDRALRVAAESIPFVARHRSTPSLLMGVDADINSGCLARYYGKTEIHVEERP